MQLIRSLPERAARPSAVAIGNFDGVHLGHQSVIHTMIAAAAAEGLVPSVLTFEPHPRRFFAPATAPFRIVRLADKLRLLADAGVAQVAMPRFDRRFAAMEAEEFLDTVLDRQLGARIVMTGENFVFGHQRRGNSEMLKVWGDKHNIIVVTMPTVCLGAQPCSSSTIRAALNAGKVAEAGRLLGRAYTLSGRIIHGDGRGRTIGFPTANVALPPGLLLPAYGVYAVRATVDGMTHDGVANLGIRPTVAVDNRPSLEVHLFDTLQEIYGKKMVVTFVDRLRAEQRFADVAALTAQIKIDCERARSALRDGA